MKDIRAVVEALSAFGRVLDHQDRVLSNRKDASILQLLRRFPDGAGLLAFVVVTDAYDLIIGRKGNQEPCLLLSGFDTHAPVDWFSFLVRSSAPSFALFTKSVRKVTLAGETVSLPVLLHGKT